MQWNMTRSPGVLVWLDGEEIQLGDTTAWCRLGRQMVRIFTIDCQHCCVMVRATCVHHCAGVVTAMLLCHPGYGDCLTETVHTVHTGVREVEKGSVLMLPMECQRKVSFTSFTGQACSRTNGEVGVEVKWTDFRWNCKR